MSVRPVDLSSRGLRMELLQRPARDSTIQMRFAPEANIEETYRTFRVRWVQMSVRGHWWVGGELLNPLPRSIIERLAEAGYLERRKQPRYSANRDVKIKWELAKRWEEAELRDYSAEGFQLRCPTRIKPASNRILVRILPDVEGERPTEISARIAWQMTAGDQRAIGCTFVRHQQFNELRQTLKALEVRAALPESVPKRRERSVRQQLGLLVAVVVMALACWLTWWWQ